MEQYKQMNQMMKSNKAEHQRLYREYLDQQSQIHKENEALNIPDPNDKNQLIMPSYTYLNRAMPTNKKAKDSIELVKNNTLFDGTGKPMNKFFSWEAQYETLIDYGKCTFLFEGAKNYYLGDTKLKHNPITLPVNDNEYNKYVYRQKHEYIQPGSYGQQPFQHNGYANGHINQNPLNNSLQKVGSHIMG